MNTNDYAVKVPTPQAMEQLGAALASVLEAGDLLLLRGCLGAGKTTLVRGLARAAGFTGKVTSPTFTLMNIYPVTPPLYHFDFYRLENGGDIEDLGLDDHIGHDGIALVEWPEIALEQLPAEQLGVDISLCEDDYERERLVHIRAVGADYQPKLERLMQIVAAGDR